MRLIDADALIDRMYHDAFENDESYNETNPMARWDSGLWIRYKMFENAIDEQPTIEPKQGEWIKHDEERDCCSVCKHIFKTRTLTKQDKWTIYVDDLGYNYCPNCGCRMKGADDEGLR